MNTEYYKERHVFRGFKNSEFSKMLKTKTEMKVQR